LNEVAKISEKPISDIQQDVPVNHDYNNAINLLKNKAKKSKVTIEKQFLRRENSIDYEI
jgi:hypothetical protein